jgi:NADH:ubiquinone oxidoreductase subunit 6 (subunit J)
MKRLLGVLLIVVTFGAIGFMVYLDISEHGVTEIVHYLAHIMVCVTFCTLFHNPVHKFFQWMKSLLGFKSDDCCRH